MPFSTLCFCSRKVLIEIYLMYFLLVNNSAIGFPRSSRRHPLRSMVGIGVRRSDAFSTFQIPIHIHTATPLICWWVRKWVHTVTILIILCTNRIAIVTCVLIGTIRSSFAWSWNYVSIFIIGRALTTQRIYSFLACVVGWHGFIFMQFYFIHSSNLMRRTLYPNRL